jgi:3-isopropylmalate dehydrogenase
MIYKLLVLPGDGIGPEIVAEALKVLAALKREYDFRYELEQGLIGGAAYDAAGEPLPQSTLDLARASDAMLLGAVGGPQYERCPRDLRPERGLLSLRHALDLFSNLRPARLYSQLVDASALKPERVADLDLMIVRELTGGIYFGKPRGIRTLLDGEREGFNTLVYREREIERVAHSAFEVAVRRSKRLCSVDKANVLEVSELWREVVGRVAHDYPQVALDNMYVDNAAMQLVRAPKQFDVIVTDNLFGDILSDAAAMLTGSIGMLPSASLNAERKGLYEPVHGSAPDLAGLGIANPLATILSVAMMLRYSLNESELANRVEEAVGRVLIDGWRTPDIFAPGARQATTAQMGDAVAAALQTA